MWSCRWLMEDDTADLSRPDRSHYVLDCMPDFITVRNDETGQVEHIQVVQIWCDPKRPDAHRDPHLRAYLERRAKDRIIGLVRFDDENAIALFPPSLSKGGRWIEKSSGHRTASHTPEQLVAALGSMQIKLIDR
jgi:hypothetical protein